MLRRSLIGLAVLLLSPAAASAVQIDWTGQQSVIAMNTGGVFAATDTSTVFTARSNFPTTCGAGCTPDPFEPPDEQNYPLSGFAHEISFGATTITFNTGNLNIQNDHVLDSGELSLLAMFGITVPSGTAVDVWTVGGESADGLIEFDVALLSLDTTLFDDFSYRGAIPDLGRIDLIAFSLEEDDVLGNNLYTSFGLATLVPEPQLAALLVLASAMITARRQYSRG